MKRSLLTGLFLCFVAIVETFTPEPVLSAPFPFALTAAPYFVSHASPRSDQPAADLFNRKL